MSGSQSQNQGRSPESRGRHSRSAGKIEESFSQKISAPQMRETQKIDEIIRKSMLKNTTKTSPSKSRGGDWQVLRGKTTTSDQNQKRKS